MSPRWRIIVHRKLRETYVISADSREEAEERALDRAEEPESTGELDAFVQRSEPELTLADNRQLRIPEVDE